MKYRLLFLILHGFAAYVALRGAFIIRFYFDPLPFRYDEMLLHTLPIAVGVKMLAADVLGLNRCIWRYASFRDVKPVVAASILGTLVFIPLVFWMEGTGYPNGPLLLDFLFTVVFFTSIRFSGRFFFELKLLLKGVGREKGLRILILGAGDRGEIALRFLQSTNQVVGFLDIEDNVVGRYLLGLPVLGTDKDLGMILEKKRIDEVVIALENPAPDLIRTVFERGSSAGSRVSLMPALSSAEFAHSNPIRELKMSDFLGRKPVQLDPAPLVASLGGLTVLVTGAGGSIGSELCRQIAALPIAKLLLVDHSENALFEISEELKQADVTPALEVLLCDIRFYEDLAAVFAVHHPQVVYHAAACKHVPMMELHPLDAARTNVLGTRNVVELAQANGVKRFLHVSTDKAVEAEGIMGASKAWGEKIVRAAGYSCVRFGNVLGSSGSVIPLFEKQWDRNGQLQVTHREATRYFMTIEEAVLLILHAEALKGEGEVYILDMGVPVKILDLAKQMVSMRSMQKLEDGGSEAAGDGRWEMEDGGNSVAGDGRSEMEDGSAVDAPTSNSQLPTLAPKVLPPIRIVGLRPGERIHERLHTLEEQLESTPVPKVNKLSGDFETVGLEEKLEKLKSAVEIRDMDGIRKLLMNTE
jgi:FlaA1/EpsC-like NDP-sugar epimerase